MVSIPMPTSLTPPQEENTLVARALADPQAFTELYQRHFTAIYRYHLARTADTPSAQDLTAQTFIIALEDLPQYRQAGPFRAWLFGIARNLQAMYWRGSHRQAPLEAADALPDPAPLPEAQAGQRLLLAQAAQALEYLNPQRREALLLCLFGGLEAEEASLVMMKSPAAVKMLLLRGLQDLRGLLGAALEVDE